MRTVVASTIFLLLSWCESASCFLLKASEHDVAPMWRQEMPGAIVATAERAAEIAKLRYFERAGGGRSWSGIYDLSILQLEHGILGFADRGSKVWEIRLAHLTHMELRAILWVDSSTGDVLPVLGDWPSLLESGPELTVGRAEISAQLGDLTRRSLSDQSKNLESELSTKYERSLVAEGKRFRATSEDLETVKMNKLAKFAQGHTVRDGEKLPLYCPNPTYWDRSMQSTEVGRQLAGDLAFVQYARQATDKRPGTISLHDITLVKLGIRVPSFADAREYVWEVEFRDGLGQIHAVYWVHSESGTILPIHDPMSGRGMSTAGRVIPYDPGVEDRIKVEGDLKVYTIPNEDGR